MKEKRILIICSESEVHIIEKSVQSLRGYCVEIETAEKILTMGVEKYLSEMIELINNNSHRYDGIVGTRDMTSVFASVICEQTGKPSTSLDSLINCQNKYLSRQVQRKSVPESTPGFWLDSHFLREFSMTPPFFVKPVRGNVSYLSQLVYSYEDLRVIIYKNTADLAQYNQSFLEALHTASHLSNQTNLETCNKFLCEESVDGVQLTVNGFVFEGDINFYGNARAVFMEDNLSFSHHEYPYYFSQPIEDKLQDIMYRLVQALGLDNTFFNVEVRVDEENQRINIIEVNCRAAFQFAKTVEAVTGINLIQWLCNIAAGERPEEKTSDKSKKTFSYCVNFELRETEDKEIVRIPMNTDLEEIEILYPEVTVKNMVEAQTKLSDYRQNPLSYRYCILDVPGNSRQEISQKYADIIPRLGYEFKD
ncbi:MAG: ATP-grasp domain-containing protein [bacterium]